LGLAGGLAAGFGRGAGVAATGAGVGFAAGGGVATGLDVAPGLVVVPPVAGRGGRAATTTPVGVGCGWSVGDALADAAGEAGAIEAGCDGDDSGGPTEAIGVGSEGWEGCVDGARTLGEGLAAATPGRGVRGAVAPTARANVASTRLRTPNATTRRARCAGVTPCVLLSTVRGRPVPSCCDQYDGSTGRRPNVPEWCAASPEMRFVQRDVTCWSAA
jgi:hypothetical protein